jgi:hypothetical protein
MSAPELPPFPQEALIPQLQSGMLSGHEAAQLSAYLAYRVFLELTHICDTLIRIENVLRDRQEAGPMMEPVRDEG